MKRAFFITGHGRSGTHYMAYLFKHFGYSVGAQCDQKHGQSHNFPPRRLWPPCRIRDEYKHIIQVVRNPRRVVESAYLGDYSLAHQNTPRIPAIDQGTLLEKTIRSVALWNWAIKRAQPDLVVKVEDAPRVCREWLERTGIPCGAHGELPPTNANTRRYPGWNYLSKSNPYKPVPWDTVSPEVMETFNAHCDEYGYPR